MVKFTVEFESGYETTVCIDREDATNTEYWVAITERQNPYDAMDEPLRVDGVELDEDGAWLETVDDRLCEAYDLTPDELYS